LPIRTEASWIASSLSKTQRKFNPVYFTIFAAFRLYSICLGFIIAKKKTAVPEALKLSDAAEGNGGLCCD